MAGGGGYCEKLCMLPAALELGFLVLREPFGRPGPRLDFTSPSGCALLRSDGAPFITLSTNESD